MMEKRSVSPVGPGISYSGDCPLRVTAARYSADGYTEFRHWRNRRTRNGRGRCQWRFRKLRAVTGVGGFVSGITPFGSRVDLARVVGGRRGNLGSDELGVKLILNSPPSGRGVVGRSARSAVGPNRAASIRGRSGRLLESTVSLLVPLTGAQVTPGRPWPSPFKCFRPLPHAGTRGKYDDSRYSL